MCIIVVDLEQADESKKGWFKCLRWFNLGFEVGIGCDFMLVEYKFVIASL